MMTLSQQAGQENSFLIDRSLLFNENCQDPADLSRKKERNALCVLSKRLSQSLGQSVAKEGNSDLAPEVLLHIFKFLSEDRDLDSVKQVCKYWHNVANDPHLVSPLKQVVQQEVEGLRSKLDHCMRCSEGYMGGYYMGLWVDDRGHFHALDGHDAETCWLREQTRQSRKETHYIQPQEELYCLEMGMRATDWNLERGETAFFVLNRKERLPETIKKIQVLILDELNQLARGAWKIAKAKSIKREWMQQPWFQVMNSAIYSRLELMQGSSQKKFSLYPSC